MSKTVPDIPIDIPVPAAVVKADYTADTVPDDIKNKVIKNNVLFIDVVNAGAKVGTGLEDDEATNRGLIKNHWTFRGHVDLGQDGLEVIGQVQFGMDVVPPASIGSNEGQYAMSSRSDPGTGSNFSYSPVGSFSKPPAPNSDDGVPVALPLVSATGEGSHESFSDVESVGKPPDITSSGGLRFQQPIEGAPYPGVFNVKVRGRTDPSRSVVVVFELRLAPGTTIGQLLDALINCNMTPFFFRKIGVAYLGCRDFISQAISTWLPGGLLVSAEAVMILSNPDAEGDIVIDDNDIRSLLGYRYTSPLIPIGVPDVSAVVQTRHGAARARNFIDRAVWPDKFVHIEHEKLLYNQVIAIPSNASAY